MDLPNRRQRRLLAKQAGLLKKKSEASFSEQLEISRRARELGRTIHLYNVEEQMRKSEDKQIEKESSLLNSLVEEGNTQSEALEKMTEINGNMDSRGE